MDKYHPGYFGKVGMRTYHFNKHGAYRPSINLDRVYALLPVDVRKSYESSLASATDKSTVPAPVIDLTNHGYQKVLGRGSLPHPVVIKARWFTRVAEDKIKKAGGACESTLL